MYKVSKEIKALLVCKVFKVLRDHKVRLGFRDRLDYRALLV